MKAQLFSSDLLAGIFIFLILTGLITYSYSQILDSHSRDAQRKFLEIETMKFFENLFRTKGLPENWEDSTASEYSSDQNTKGLWHLNEGSGSTAGDISGNGNNGTIYNNGAAGAEWVTCQFSTNCVNFSTLVLSQPDKIEIAASSGGSLDIHGPMTEEAWIYPAKVSGTQGIATRNFHSALWLNSGKIKFGVDGFSGFVSITSNSTIEPNAWTHVAGVFDSLAGRLYIYINGTLDISGPATVNTWYTNSNPFVIGNSRYAVLGSDHCCPFSGKIEEIRISDLPRSSFNIGGPDPVVLGLSTGNNNVLDSDKVKKFFYMGYGSIKNISGLGSDFEVKFIGSGQSKGSAPNSSIENIIFLRRLADSTNAIENAEKRI